MYFHSIQIQNYKGYRDSASLELNTGINIVVGKNNVGKTALLEAMSLKFAAHPHRSLSTVPTLSRVPKSTSTVSFTFSLTREELTDILITAQRQATVELRLSLPAKTDPIWKKLKFKQYNDATANRFCEWFLSQNFYVFRMQREAFNGGSDGNWYVTDDLYVSPHYERSSENGGRTRHYGNFNLNLHTRDFSFRGHTTVSEGDERHSDDFLLRVGRHLRDYVYMFRAERIPFEPCHLGTERTLASDARNLAEVIHLLQENLEQFNEFNRVVREVLPNIQQVGTQKVDDKNQGEVFVWNNKAATSRNDLAFSLKESGAGVGQVLAILYVLITATEPQMIIIDEPQGFLHPGAVRKLVDVLRRYSESKHQLIIATHSPTVITSADPTTVTLIKQHKAESVFENISIKDVKQQQKYLSVIGSRLSDVFGYDRVLWVEGETEEICFPFILREMTKQPLLGTAILRVQHTGDFNRKDARSVIAIYERLSQLEGGLVPPIIGFIFDKEIRSTKEQDDLKRESRNRIHFTGKRLYENYLLNPAGIAAVANSIEGFSKHRITERQVRKWIDVHKREPKYFRPLKFPTDNEESWTETVHGALLLEDLFTELSKGLVFYDKTDHSVMLTEWVVKNAPEDLCGIAQLLVDVFSKIDDPEK